MAYDIAVVCALHEHELDRVLDTGAKPWRPLHVPNDPTVYYETLYPRENGIALRVVAAAAPQMGMTASAILTTKMILHFAPRLVAMVGLAAGANAEDQGIGDILAPDTTFDFDSGKLVPDGDNLKLKADAKPLSIEARLAARLREWKRQSRHVDAIRNAWPAQKPRTSLGIHVGPLGSGSTVLGSRKPLADVLEQWRKLIGIEMEAHGVHFACHNASSPPPSFLCIKSICDFAADKTDQWQAYAAFTAAQFFHRFVIEEWESFAFPNRVVVADPGRQAESAMPGVVLEINALKEQLATQKELLALQAGSIREILAAITTSNTPTRVSTAIVDGGDTGLSELQALEGLWVNEESGSTYCMRIINGELRCPYAYGSRNRITGEYHALRFTKGTLVGRYRWFNNPIAGYFYLRVESSERLVGGWWSAGGDDAEAVVVSADAALPPPSPFMVSCTWVRQKGVQQFPDWAEAFFESLAGK